MGIEHAGTKSHTSQKVRMWILCTYPTRIEYARINLIKVKVEHVGTPTNFAHISYEN